MASVDLREGESPEHLITRFRQVVQRDGILREIKQRRHFIPKSDGAASPAQRPPAAAVAPSRRPRPPSNPRTPAHCATPSASSSFVRRKKPYSSWNAAPCSRCRVELDQAWLGMTAALNDAVLDAIDADALLLRSWLLQRASDDRARS